jgi:hypothetical protein
MTKEEFILKLLKEGREWVKQLSPLILPLITLHLPQPRYMKKKKTNDDRSE